MGQWDNVSCLLGLMSLSRLFVSHMGGERPMQYQRPGKHDTLKQCWASLADSGPA